MGIFVWIHYENTQQTKEFSIFSEMSGGGHFSSYWVSRKNPTRYFPSINRPGSLNLTPFLTQSGLPETDKSKDPLLVSKPLTEKKPDSPHESDRIVHTRFVHTNGLQNNLHQS